MYFMKLLTLNTHSLAEPDCEAKTKIFLQAVLEERPDVMALQEVNQTAGGEDVSTVELLASGYMECPNTMPRVGRDNHAFRTAVWLAEHDFPCFWRTWGIASQLRWTRRKRRSCGSWAGR